jgi:acyl-[acyl-carrier-protein]-phospholipid O-acyltransferase / long-chain-fatty-acid--[acyl-carrier-protein] ligase
MTKFNNFLAAVSSWFSQRFGVSGKLGNTESSMSPQSCRPRPFIPLAKGPALWLAVIAVGAFHLSFLYPPCAAFIAVFLGCLFQLSRLATTRQAFYTGLSIGFAVYAPELGFFWKIFGASALGLWLILALWLALFLLLARTCRARFPVAITALLIPVVWLALEYFRSEVYYLRFSWLSAGYAFAHAPQVYQVTHLGVYGVSWALMLIITVGSCLPHFWKAGAGWAGLVLLLFLTRPADLTPGTQEKSPLALPVAGIQKELPGPMEAEAALNDLQAANPAATLLMLSEYTFDGPVPQRILKWCQDHQKYLIVGGKDLVSSRKFFDTAFVINPQGRIIFKQAKSVPIQFFDDGLPAVRLALWESSWGKMGICVCYDLSYRRVVDRLVKGGAQALFAPALEITDWGLQAHRLNALVTLVRAAEYGLPIFRVAGSGISQLVSPAGHLTAMAPYPGDGAMLAGQLSIVKQGMLPFDHYLGPLSLLILLVVIVWVAIDMNRLYRFLLRCCYRYQAFNTAALRTPGPVLLIPNHLSWLDWLLVGAVLDKDWRFVTSSVTAQISWVHRKIMVNRRTFPIDPTSPYAVKRMAEYLQSGGRLVLFAEGRLSLTGTLMKLFDGTGFLLHKTGARVVTAYLRNAQRLPWVRHSGWTQWFPRVSVHFSDLLQPPRLEHISTSQARQQLTTWLRDHMVRQQFEVETALGPQTVLDAVRDMARQRPAQIVLEDANRQVLTYRRLMIGAHCLARQWPRILLDEPERLGVLLPNVNAMPIVILSLWAAGKVPAVMNYSTGVPAMLLCAQLAGVKQIITSARFLERARIAGEPFRQAGIELLMLEEIRPKISATQKLAALFAQASGKALANPRIKTGDPAVILFTSGSEGTPKGVELTHANLLANIRQLLAVTDIKDDDRLFNTLPLFHSFGLSVGAFLPLIRGLYLFLYPSPLHYRLVPAVIYDRYCTIFLSTNTFLNGYARKAHPYDFRSVRYLFAAAEKVQETTANLWARRFGLRILEGYGATECSPGLCISSSMEPRFGSVGRFLPGIEYQLEPVEGVAEGGRLLVRGPNIMRGYLNSEANAKFLALQGWYDTGDIARVDADGFVFILGRLKRFAKVSGEMVSLTAVEEALAGAFPHYGLRCQIAVVSQPDEEKGERLIAITNESRLKLDEIRTVIRGKGLTNLCVPREIKFVREIPKLGTGKINHRELAKMI